MNRRTRPQKDNLSGLKNWKQQLISRRKFIFASLSVSAMHNNLFTHPATASTLNDRRATKTKKQIPATSPIILLSKPQQRRLSAVQNHLFPLDINSPSAQDINALAYLQKNIFENSLIETEEKQFLINGTGWLNDLSQTTFTQHFIDLNTQQKEQLLRKIANSSAGENWLSSVLLYLFEALLCDPIYGGNPKGIGWQWLEHTPGFPHPPASKIYGRLKKTTLYQKDESSLNNPSI